jgi:hypothetical protein
MLGRGLGAVEESLAFALHVLCVCCFTSLVINLAGCGSKTGQNNRQAAPTPSTHESQESQSGSQNIDSRQASENSRHESTSIDPVIQAKHDYVDALEQAKQKNILEIQQANDNYSRATEQYQHEYWATVGQYHSMTPQEKAQIHPRSLKQIMEDHEEELRRARKEYSAEAAAARKTYEDCVRRFPAASGELMRPPTLPDSGQSELLPGTLFEYERHPTGYLSAELCSATSLGLCYPHDWKPWLKQLEREATGEQFASLDADTGMQDPGNVVVSWDKQKRVLFEACRSHDCDAGEVYFIVGPATKDLDIVWKSESAIQYFGPNATKLKAANAFDWLSIIAQ